MERNKRNKRKGDKQGPKPEALKIEGNWEEAVKIVLSKKKPKDGKK